MNKKGFTIVVELLVTITLLAIISTIAAISITSFINKNKENNYEILKNTILEASKEYVTDNRYGNIDSSITAQYLLDNHYITSGLTDPKTGKNIDLSSVIITITYQNKNYTYEIKQEDWKLEDGKLNKTLLQFSQDTRK